MRAAICLLAAALSALPAPPAFGQAHQEGLEAGAAANSAIQGLVTEHSARTVVPGYTATPPESAYYGQPNLTDQARSRVMACQGAADPGCEATQTAVGSAATPREGVSTGDPAVADAAAIARDPGSPLSLSEHYAACAPSATKTTGTPPSCGPYQVCLGEACYNTASPNDPDFARTVTLLEAGREAGVYLDPATLQVFKGYDNRCSERLFGLGNCCKVDGRGKAENNHALLGRGSMYVFDLLFDGDNRAFVVGGIKHLLWDTGFSGTYSSFGLTIAYNGAALPASAVPLASSGNFVLAFDPWSLAIAVVIYVVMEALSCDKDENVLAMKRGASLCRGTGSYCASRFLGICRTRKQSYCCFNSRLARLINEQGRAQIGKGWGSARDPDCSGFTVGELQGLNFAAMDLSEFYAEIVPTLPNASTFADAARARVPDCYYGQGKCQ